MVFDLLRQAEGGAVFMTVPEAAMDEDDRAVLGQDEVGFAGEGPVIRAADGEAEAEAVEHGAQDELGPGVAAADAGHDCGTFGGGEDIGHGRRGGIQYQTRNAECRREDWIDRRGAEVAKGR